MSNIFWSSTQPDPKRQYRFELIINPPEGGSGLATVPAFTIKTVSKPKVTVSSVPHMYLDHEFKYPGRVTWDPVSVTLVDPGNKGQDMAFSLMERMGLSGYKYPTTDAVAKVALSKEKANKAAGRTVYIRQLDAEGLTVEQWGLRNAFITSLDFGGLDYSADELSEVTVEFTYDWAELNGGETAVPNPSANLLGTPGGSPESLRK